jgi:hypothetical protein
VPDSYNYTTVPTAHISVRSIPELEIVVCHESFSGVAYVFSASRTTPEIPKGYATLGLRPRRTFSFGIKDTISRTRCGFLPIHETLGWLVSRLHGKTCGLSRMTIDLADLRYQKTSITEVDPSESCRLASPSRRVRLIFLSARRWTFMHRVPIRGPRSLTDNAIMIIELSLIYRTIMAKCVSMWTTFFSLYPRLARDSSMNTSD